MFRFSDLEALDALVGPVRLDELEYGAHLAGWPGCHAIVLKGPLMATINLTGEQFNGTVRGEGITIVDFWATWCGPCQRFSPVFEKASEANPDITFAKVDTEAEQGLATALGISSIPTLMVFRDDVLVYREAGALPAKALDALITQVRELDMDEVKAKVAAQES